MRWKLPCLLQCIGTLQLPKLLPCRCALYFFCEVWYANCSRGVWIRTKVASGRRQMYLPLFQVFRQDAATCLIEFLLFGAFCNFSHLPLLAALAVAGLILATSYRSVAVPCLSSMDMLPSHFRIAPSSFHSVPFSAMNLPYCSTWLLSTSTIYGVPGGVARIRSATINREMPSGFGWRRIEVSDRLGAPKLRKKTHTSQTPARSCKRRALERWPCLQR